MVRKTKINRKRKGSALRMLRTCCYVSCACLALSLVVYLSLVNMLASKGYEMRKVENSIEEFAKEHKMMQIRQAELKSLYAIEDASAEYSSVSPEEVRYVREVSAFAYRK